MVRPHWEKPQLESIRNLSLTHYLGIGFVRGDGELTDVKAILSSEDAIAISVDGHAVREVPGPQGLPYIGNFFEVFPDHLGNHQRLFEKYGPLFKTTNMGGTIYHSNDPDIAAIAFAESDFFTKKINEAHPLFGIKTPEAGVFLGDTDTPEWKVTHKFLPPALGPKAVRHYAPTMQKTIEEAFKVFDELNETGQSWNVYIYMLKLGSQAVAKLTLGLDLQHFSHVDAPVHEIVRLIAETLHLNKKVTSYGSWYANLPFGDPKALKVKKARMEVLIEEQIAKASSGGVEDLPLQEAAIKADNMVGKLIRSLLERRLLPLNTFLHSHRLRSPRNRQQGRKAAQDQFQGGSCGRHRCWIHNNIIFAFVAHLRPRHIPWCAREAAAGAHRQRLQRRDGDYCRIH
jgi:hypothetical protein